MSSPASIVNKTFKGLLITNFDSDYEDCTFIDCKLNMAFVDFIRCTFINCQDVVCREAVELKDCTWTNCTRENWQYGQQCFYRDEGKLLSASGEDLLAIFCPY